MVIFLLNLINYLMKVYYLHGCFLEALEPIEVYLTHYYHSHPYQDINQL